MHADYQPDRCQELPDITWKHLPPLETFKIRQIKSVAPLGFVVAQNIINNALDGSFDTWLSEHDKDVKVKVLEEVVRRAGETDTVLDLIEEIKHSK